MAVGSSERLIDELMQQGKRNLTVIANDTAMPGTATSPTDGNSREKVPLVFFDVHQFQIGLFRLPKASAETGLRSMAPKVESSLSFWAERAVGLLAIGAILFACFWIAKPLLFVLAWGALIAIALAPLYRVLARAGGNRPKAAATVIVLFLLALVIFPLSYLPASFQGAAEGLAGVTNNWTELKLPPLPSWVSGVPWVGPIINERWTAAASNSPSC